MVFKATVTPKQEQRLIQQLHLVECTKDGKVFWTDSAWSQLSGIYCTIKNHSMKLACSVHKQVQQALSGQLDNSRPCTMTQAIQVMTAMFDSSPSGLDIPLDRITVTYFELGLSFPMSHPAIDYISQMRCVGFDDKKREMFVDFKWQKNRQKVTAMTRHVRKVLKVYDKTFEADERGRIVDSNILRCETQYKRCSIKLLDLLSPAMLGKFMMTYYQDWTHVVWDRHVTGVKGTKESQIIKAREIITEGVESYLERHRQEWKAGTIGRKAWAVYRDFARDWDKLKNNFQMERGPLEAEYDNKFHMAYVYAQN